MDPDFADVLGRCLASIPRGRVATCGSIARALGDVRAARAVATWLADHPDTVGGHRVVRADGRPVLRDPRSRRARSGLRPRGGRIDPARFSRPLPPIRFLDVLRREQRGLEPAIVEHDELAPIARVAGVDVSYRGDTMYAAAVSLSLEDEEAVEVALVRALVSFPYIPTYLAFRELPGIEAVVKRLSTRPDVLLVDGHGRLHPALFGIACHAGLRLGLRTIGVAKHPLAGRIQPKPIRSGAFSMEIDGHMQGLAWIPPGRARPIYISVGHRVSLEGAFDLVRRCTVRGYPEPLKIADRISREMRGNEKREKGARK